MKNQKIVYVYKTDDGIFYANLKKNKFEAWQSAIEHIEKGDYIPSHILINDKVEVKLEDINELVNIKKTIKTMKAQGITEKDTIFFF